MDDEEDHEYNDGKYTLKEISAINIATDQYWSALLMVYGFLHLFSFKTPILYENS